AALERYRKSTSSAEIRNPNIEIRNNFEIRNLKQVWNISVLDIGICFGFRYSDFGFAAVTACRRRRRYNASHGEEEKSPRGYAEKPLEAAAPARLDALVSAARRARRRHALARTRPGEGRSQPQADHHSARGTKRGHAGGGRERL